MRSAVFCLATLVLVIFSSQNLLALEDDENPALKTLQAKLRETNPKLAMEFGRRVKQSLTEVNQYQRGHVVFGQIQVEGDKDPRAVVSQMIILKGGYFVDAIGAAGNPIGFRLNGYESAVVTPAGPGPIEELQPIVMKRLPAERLCAAKGRLQLESHPDVAKPEDLTVTWDLPADPINTPSNGTEGLTGFYQPVVSQVAADGTFAVSELSPGKSNIRVNAQNYVHYFRTVELAEGETQKLDVIQLDLVRKMNVEYAVSKEGDFDGVEFKKTSLSANDRWRSNNDVPEYGFDLMIGQKDRKLVLDYRYGPCHIQDLGVADLSDELKVDMNALKAKQPQSVPVEEGHVYIVLQSSWKHWILFRATDVNTIATEAPKNE